MGFEIALLFGSVGTAWTLKLWFLITFVALVVVQVSSLLVKATTAVATIAHAAICQLLHKLRPHHAYKHHFL